MIPARRTRPDTKIQALCTSLRALALSQGPAAKLPTARELREQFAVSQVTLNDALTILEAQQVIYRKQSSGIYVSPHIHRKNMCLLLDSRLFLASTSSPFWGLLWGSMTEEMQRRVAGRNEYYSVHSVIPGPGDVLLLPEEVIALVQAGRVHGILSCGLQSPASSWLKDQGVPCVTFAGHSDYIVAVDSAELIRLGVESLAEQGCRRIELWMPASMDPEHQQYLRDYAQVFADCLLTHGLSMHIEQVKYGKTDVQGFAQIFQEQGYQLALQNFCDDSWVRPDGLLLSDDMMTFGVLTALQELGIQVGKDIKIATHSNKGSQVLFGHKKQLTLIEFDPAEIVQTMFRTLDLLLAGNAPAEHVLDCLPQLVR